MTDDRQRPPIDLDGLLELAGLHRPEWQKRANCRGHDPATFFPGRTGAARTVTAQARAICDACPVAKQCAEHAITNHEKFGIWGGLSERQRRAERRRRQGDAA